jgi:hypothetical protein
MTNAASAEQNPAYGRPHLTVVEVRMMRVNRANTWRTGTALVLVAGGVLPCLAEGSLERYEPIVERRIFGVPDAGPAAVVPEWADRYRLAGTHVVTETNAVEGVEGPVASQAFMEDRSSGQGFWVARGAQLDEHELVEVTHKSAVFEAADGAQITFALFAGTAVASARNAGSVSEPEPGESASEPMTFEEMPALETSRFGKRIGENRWLFDRDKVLEYADDVQEDPLRLARMLAAMQPEFDEERAVTGFKLSLLGENELYEAAGFQEGDVVRQVNSMAMTSPARARYFIREFLNGNMGAVVFDIERDGQTQKLIHIVN